MTLPRVCRIVCIMLVECCLSCFHGSGTPTRRAIVILAVLEEGNVAFQGSAC